MDISNIEVFTQSSIRIRCDAGTVYADPFRMKTSPHDADIVLITHDHYDHFSPEDLAKVINPATILVVPEKLADKAAAFSAQVKAIETVLPGQQYQIAGLSFRIMDYNRLAYNLESSRSLSVLIIVIVHDLAAGPDLTVVSIIQEFSGSVNVIPYFGTPPSQESI